MPAIAGPRLEWLGPAASARKKALTADSRMDALWGALGPIPEPDRVAELGEGRPARLVQDGREHWAIYPALVLRPHDRSGADRSREVGAFCA